MMLLGRQLDVLCAGVYPGWALGLASGQVPLSSRHGFTLLGAANEFANAGRWRTGLDSPHSSR